MTELENMAQNFTRFVKKKKLKNISKKKKCHSTDDDCYSKKIC